MPPAEWCSFGHCRGFGVGVESPAEQLPRPLLTRIGDRRGRYQCAMIAAHSVGGPALPEMPFLGSMRRPSSRWAERTDRTATARPTEAAAVMKRAVAAARIATPGRQAAEICMRRQLESAIRHRRVFRWPGAGRAFCPDQGE